MNTEGLLSQLSEASGISGYESAIAGILTQYVAPYVHDVTSDALGNLIMHKAGVRDEKSPPRSIMLAAHTDEIGLMVTKLEEGFIRFTRIGGVDVRTILGQEVVVHGKRPLVGIVGSRPPHVLSQKERQQPPTLEKLFVDVGLSADGLAGLVQPGDLITMKREFLPLAHGYASGKALDDRAGVAAVAFCLEELATLQHSWDVYAVATSQEEVGLRGAMVSAYGIAPDVAIAIDVGFGKQQGVKEKESIEMDGGPAIARGPNLHPKMYQGLLDTAQEYELKHQTEVIPGRSGTDAWAIQVARDGIPTGLLSIPLRYMHTSVETICLQDIGRTGRLMARFIAKLDEPFAEAFGLGWEEA